MDQIHQQGESRKRKLLVTFAVVALMAGVGVFVTSAAFTATTSSSGNQIESGSVAIGDSDATTGVLYNALDQAPGAANGPAPKCVRVTYSGSLGSAVKLYRSAVSYGDKFHLKVERGSGLSAPASDMNCTGFTPDGGVAAFDDTLDQFPTTYAGGIDGKASGAAWATGNTVDYRFTVYTVDDSTPNARTSEYDSTSHSFTWEAR
ncbi:MAG: hypothetical protein ACRDL0_01040, partial [Thermoleophilaceae bacterium]